VTNRNKAKGTAWETEIVTVLREAGIDSARRVVQAGAADVGDVHVGAILSPLVAIEAKNEKALSFSSYVDEANVEGDNAGALFGGVAWVKRRGKASARDGYVVMDGATFIDMAPRPGHKGVTVVPGELFDALANEAA
jgi:Holliday junction resolvase